MNRGNDVQDFSPDKVDFPNIVADKFSVIRDWCNTVLRRCSGLLHHFPFFEEVKTFPY